MIADRHLALGLTWREGLADPQFWLWAAVVIVLTVLVVKAARGG